MEPKVVVLPLELEASGKRVNAAPAEKVWSLLEEILWLYPSGAGDWEGSIYDFQSYQAVVIFV